MELKELINRISYIRTQAKLSARKLSMEIGKTEGYISRLENVGDFAPTFETLLDILNVCNISIEQFFYYNITAYAQDMEIIELLKEIGNEEKSAFITLLKGLKKECR